MNEIPRSEYLTCTRKVKFRTRAKAMKVVKESHAGLKTYKCGYCGEWHLTKKANYERYGHDWRSAG